MRKNKRLTKKIILKAEKTFIYRIVKFVKIFGCQGVFISKTFFL